MSSKHPPLPSDSAPFDDDNPEWTAAMFAKAQPAEAVLPPEVLAAFKRPRGRPAKAAPKVRIAVRLDLDVVAHFRTTGPG